MATAVFAETLENLQNSTLFIAESRSYAFSTPSLTNIPTLNRTLESELKQ
jgi:hypothetical protein